MSFTVSVFCLLSDIKTSMTHCLLFAPTHLAACFTSPDVPSEPVCMGSVTKESRSCLCHPPWRNICYSNLRGYCTDEECFFLKLLLRYEEVLKWHDDIQTVEKGQCCLRCISFTEAFISFFVYFFGTVVKITASYTQTTLPAGLEPSSHTLINNCKSEKVGKIKKMKKKSDCCIMNPRQFCVFQTGDVSGGL